MNETNPENKCVQLYNEGELNKMLKMQFDLQQLYKKENPDSDVHDPNEPLNQKIFDAVYHWNSFTLEYWELNDANEKLNKLFNNALYEKQLLELQFEVIDMWHFLMNIFIFTDRIVFPRSLEYYFDKVFNYYKDYGENLDITFAWDKITLAYSNYMNDLPYKKWKKYKNGCFFLSEKKAEELLVWFFVICTGFDIDCKKLYSLYVSKNKEEL